MSRASPLFTSVNAEVTNSMAVLQAQSDKHLRNITQTCFNHFFGYKDPSVQIDDTFDSLSMAAMSGVFITFASLCVCAIGVFLVEIWQGWPVQSRQKIMIRGDPADFDLSSEDAVGSALECLSQKWHIRNLVYDAGGVLSIDLFE